MAARFATGGSKCAVLGREAMSALEKLTSSTAWGTVPAVMKDRLASALASADTSGYRRSQHRMGASTAAQSSSAGDEQEPPALLYRQAVAQRQ